MNRQNTSFMMMPLLPSVILKILALKIALKISTLFFFCIKSLNVLQWSQISTKCLGGSFANIPDWYELTWLLNWNVLNGLSQHCSFASIFGYTWLWFLDLFVWVGCSEHWGLLVPLLSDRQVTKMVLGNFAFSIKPEEWSATELSSFPSTGLTSTASYWMKLCGIGVRYHQYISDSLHNFSFFSIKIWHWKFWVCAWNK